MVVGINGDFFVDVINACSLMEYSQIKNSNPCCVTTGVYSKALW